MFSVIITILLLFFPGYLILSFNQEKKSFWLQLVYSHALSLIYLMVVGLAINTVLPFYGIERPLESAFSRPIIFGSTTLLFFVSVIFGKIPFKQYLYSLKNIINVRPNELSILLLCSLPTLVTVMGTLLLNNKFNNTLMMVGLALLALQILIVFLLSRFFQNKTFFFLTNLLLIGTGVILMASLRGSLVTGSDIMLEYRMAAVTQENNLWSPFNPDHPYTACLSITILPVIVSNLAGIPLNWVYKLVLQLATILSVIPVFFVARKFVSDKTSYLASLAFLTFPSFFGIMPMHLRQSAAMLFFFLSAHLVLNGKRSISNKVFLYLFAFGMVVSHYSTTYLATAIYIAFFLAASLLFIGSFLLARYKRAENKIEELGLFKHINIFFLIFLCSTIYIWYFHVTSLSAGLSNFVQKVALSFRNDSNLDIREDTSIVNQFNIFFEKKQDESAVEEYVNILTTNYKNNDVEGNNTYYKFSIAEIEDFSLDTLYQEKMPPFINPQILQPLYIGADLVKKTYKVLTIIGVVFVAYSLIFKKEKKYDTPYLLFLGVAFSLLIAFTSLPLFTVDYDVFRTYHQLLVVLALMPVVGLTLLFSIIKLPFKNFFIVTFFVFYFSLSTGLFYQLFGGYSYSLTLNNKGDDYDRYYIQEGEILSSQWIEKNREQYAPIHTDTYTKQKLRALSTDPLPVYDEITPISITQLGYVFLTQSQMENSAAYKNLNNRLIKHRIPKDFISQKKDKVYSNSKSEIYK